MQNEEPRELEETDVVAPAKRANAQCDDPNRRVGDCVSHYRIERRLGAGGMGQVYLARDIALGRDVALKILPESFSPALRERLLREAWASARMQHPSIATFYEAGESNETAFVAMEYVEGRTLKDEMRNGPLPLPRAVRFCSRLLEGLAHAHAAEILHRDIKPANIMCTASGGAKLLDFGLARHTDQMAPDADEHSPAPPVDLVCDETLEYSPESTPATAHQLNSLHGLTQHGAILGTLGYMSPEQLGGSAVDIRTDVFSMGAVFYEMLTGRPAFPGATAHQRIDATLHLTPPPVDVGEESAAVNRIVKRAIAKQTRDRYSSAADFLRDLRELEQTPDSEADVGRVAVLDPKNQSGVDALDWLSTGLADALTAQLGQARLNIVPRPAITAAITSVVASEFELGLHLGARWLVSGEYEQDSDDAIAIHLKLIDVPARVLFDEFECRGSLKRLFELQQSVAAGILQRLRPEASRPNALVAQGPSVEAYKCYVRGRRELFQYGKASFDRAEELLERAVALHPAYAQAWAGLAQISGMRFLFSHDPSTLDRAIELARKGIEADQTLAEPRIWLGYARAHQLFTFARPGQMDKAEADWREARQEMQQALDLEPNSPMAVYFAASFEQIGYRFANDAEAREACRRRALELYQHSLKIAPVSCWSWLAIGWVHLDLGNNAEAKWCLETAVDLEPKVTPPTAGVAVFLGECLRRMGMLEAAREQTLAGLQATERTDHMYRDTFRGVGLCALGRTALQMGDNDAAVAAFRQAVLHLRGRTKTRIGGHLLAQALAGLTRAGEGQAPFEEAENLFRKYEDYEFGWLWWGWDEITLLEFARAATTLGRSDDAEHYLKAAISAGSVEAESFVGS